MEEENGNKSNHWHYTESDEFKYSSTFDVSKSLEVDKRRCIVYIKYM